MPGICLILAGVPHAGRRTDAAGSDIYLARGLPCAWEGLSGCGAERRVLQHIAWVNADGYRNHDGGHETLECRQMLWLFCRWYRRCLSVFSMSVPLHYFYRYKRE